MPREATNGSFALSGAWGSGGRPTTAAVTLVVLAVAVPLLGGRYLVGTAAQTLAFSVLVVSLVLMMGHSGIPSLGQAAFFGVGGYVTGLLALHWTTDALLLALLSFVAGGVVAALVGWLLVNGSGAYLFMLTLAIGELLTRAAISNVELTGGSDGLANIPALTVLGSIPVAGPYAAYVYSLAFFLFAAYAVRRIALSPVGLAINGIRENEPRMRALGYNTRVYKYVIVVVAGAIAALGGSAWVAGIRFFSPNDMNFHGSVLALLALIIGGQRSVIGALVGSAIIIGIRDFLPLSLQGMGPVVMGVLLVVAIYLMPQGVVIAIGHWKNSIVRWMAR